MDSCNSVQNNQRIRARIGYIGYGERKLQFLVLTHEMQNAKCKMQN